MKLFISVAIATIVTMVITYGLMRSSAGQVRTVGLAALPLEVAAPDDNPSTPEKIELGRMLFWDPILSGNDDVACATCHHPDFGYAENLDISIGVNGVGLGRSRHFASPNDIPFVQRNSQSILNTAFNGIDSTGEYEPAAAPMFWDLRAEGLEAQALLPILTFEEMRGHAYSEAEAIDVVVGKLRAISEYRDLFAQAFEDDEPINAENLGRALGAFQRTLIANNSPFDRYMRGDDSAMTRQQVRGMREFQSVGCINCHSGPMFSDYQLHVLGVPDNFRLPESDRGANLTYAFRTPSLRNLAYTAPYMHSGVFSDLDDVLDFYDDGRGRGRGMGGGRGRNFNTAVSRNQLDPLFRQLRDVDDEEDEIIAFLGALNDDSFDRSIPARVPSGLNPGGRID